MELDDTQEDATTHRHANAAVDEPPQTCSGLGLAILVWLAVIGVVLWRLAHIAAPVWRLRGLPRRSGRATGVADPSSAPSPSLHLPPFLARTFRAPSLTVTSLTAPMTGLEDPSRPFRSRSGWVGECRRFAFSPADLFAACRSLSCFFVGAGGKTGGRNTVLSPRKLLQDFPAERAKIQSVFTLPGHRLAPSLRSHFARVKGKSPSCARSPLPGELVRAAFPTSVRPYDRGYHVSVPSHAAYSRSRGAPSVYRAVFASSGVSYVAV